MPRYFFTIRRADGKTDGDPDGIILPNDAAARSHAEETIRQIQREEGCDHPGPMLIVYNEVRQTLLSLPVLPGCA